MANLSCLEKTAPSLGSVGRGWVVFSSNMEDRAYISHTLLAVGQELQSVG